MNVTAVVTAEDHVVNIHMLCANLEGILTLWVFLIFSKHHAAILAAFLVYNDVIKVGGFASS